MKHFLTLLLITLSLQSFSQQGEWTWMSGDNTPNGSGVFGTKGVAASANKPPALYGAALFLDTTNNLWLFGGAGIYNTMWKYDFSINEWAWISGVTSNSAPGIYGTMGVPAPSNTPGARGYGFFSWTDLNGDFWIYGGDGYDATGYEGLLSDLWRYSVATHEWTWMNGSTLGLPAAAPVYGTQGVADPANTPGAREEATVSWVDASGNLWLFGGFDNNVGLKDDVWKYDVSLNQWVWMAGSTGEFLSPVYGTKGLASPLNTPGGRNAYASWKDDPGNLWLFGGSLLFGKVADLWKLDATTLEWTWMSGSDVMEALGNAGTQCTSDTSFYPSARAENRACWKDKCGNFWMFGGGQYRNDLWVYRPAYNDWTYAGGSLSDNATASYGQQGVSSPTNIPGGRRGSPAVYDQSGNVWMFGGKFIIADYGNDLWRFVPDTTCPALGGCSAFQVPSFTASANHVCEKFCVGFTDQSNNNPTAWLWEFPGGTPASSTDQNPSNVCYNLPGLYNVTLITTNASGNDTVTLTNYITVFATPPFPTITQVGYTLTSSPATFYQWQLNSTDIPGATNQSYMILQTGYYTIVVSDSNGCSNSTTEYILITGIDEINDGSISIYPNPSSGNFTVELLNEVSGEEISIDVVNTLGQKVFSSSLKVSYDLKMEIDLGDVARGVYFIEIKSPNEFMRKKMVME